MFNQSEPAQNQTPDALKARVSEALDYQRAELEIKYPHPQDRHLRDLEVDFLFAAAGVVLEPFAEQKRSALVVAEFLLRLNQQPESGREDG